MENLLPGSVIDAIFDFTFYYPLFMSYLWMCGGLYYYFHYERADRPFDQPPPLKEYPPVSILVPCHNEAECIEETVAALQAIDYPEFEILLIDDGSTDTTPQMLDRFTKADRRIRVIHLARNQGKAVGLNTAAMMAKHDYFLCIDGDSIVDPHCLRWMMRHLIDSPRVGAVTGNPRIRTRSTLLGRIQVGEFSSIIGLIKRAQRTYGKVFTVSGVMVCFRRAALHNAGYWNPDALTEDIDISWRLQMRHWDVRFEPNALCWILMPETMRGLWRQRLRWAMGGTQVLFSQNGLFGRWRHRRMLPVYLEYFTSVIWAYTMAAVILLWALGQFVTLPPALYVDTLIPGWNGMVIGTTCLLQFAVSMFLDAKYEKGLGRYYYWMIWYPLAYWMLSVFTTLVAIPKVILRGKKRATWVSPDRGLQP
ncbi:poly-beta-1,6 N-acetyl-D-glucosamine synthase [Rhodoferax koreense]|uniref:Poly-beta-1,6-N-acetyl-D-glucosamine synthase n=1 Tax=Rhodoferax koreensis TaxID=1842727 RepID=A0A1P8JT71_9BURK|nr:poly-beta-1,6-N-acetyl-D-glucosamine synthase [Rhodoferax koreense]APW36911.1 poly-beta-1,6 N-acetyl-D-glucosamine synthase [Rhodoferax koreense]